MNDIEKSRIRLKHWLDHNEDHLKGYEDVAALLEKEGLAEAAAKVRQGIEMTSKANDEFRAALLHYPEPASSADPDHDHNHSTGHGDHCGHHKHGHGCCNHGEH